MGESVMRSAGYTNITLAATGTKALHILHNSTQHITLLNLTLTEMRQFSLLEQISAQHSNTSIIILAPPEQPARAYKCLEKGADDYIFLPIHERIAKNIWSSAWKKKRERRTLDMLQAAQARACEKETILKDIASTI